jgi:hypothetical protein
MQPGRRLLRLADQRRVLLRRLADLRHGKIHLLDRSRDATLISPMIAFTRATRSTIPVILPAGRHARRANFAPTLARRMLNLRMNELDKLHVGNMIG